MPFLSRVGRTAIALYYIAIDEAQRAITSSPPRPSSAHSHHSGSDLEDQRRETAYQQGLRIEYPNLFASSLLQDMLYLPAGSSFLQDAGIW